MKEILWIVLIGTLVPFVTYFAVKFGMYAYFATKRRFGEDYGSQQTTEKAEEGKGIGS